MRPVYAMRSMQSGAKPNYTINTTSQQMICFYKCLDCVEVILAYFIN